jgi:hypothetical protein
MLFKAGNRDAAYQALAALHHEEDDQMEHSQYLHFWSWARAGAFPYMVMPIRDRDHVGCLSDQDLLTRALNVELDQAVKEIRRFSDQGAEASRRITLLESLCKQHEEVIEKLKQENTTLELGIQSRNELVLQMAFEMGLDRM